MDYPVAGMVLHGLGAWGLLREAMPAEDAVRLLVLAERFAYTAFATTMDPAAHRRTRPSGSRPASTARLRAEYGERTGPGPPAGGPGRRPSGSPA